MKISEEQNDGDQREQAKVNFGMANASLKWNNHVQGILAHIEGKANEEDHLDDMDGNEQVNEAPADEEEDNN